MKRLLAQLIFVSPGLLLSGFALAADITPPSLVSWTYSPNVVTTSASSAEIVSIIRITDNESGARPPALIAESATTSQSTGFATVTLISGNTLDGTWQAVVTIPQGSAPGKWYLTLFPLDDRQGNTNDGGVLGWRFQAFMVTEDAMPEGPANEDAIPQVTPATYQDWWYNPSLSGMGLNIGQQGQNLFVSWYLYDSDEDPSFLIFYGNLQGNTLTAPLRRFHGPEPDVYDETLWSGEIVGIATITFTGPSAATLDYEYDGKQGSYSIQRYTFYPINMSGVYYGGAHLTTTNCGENNGNASYPEAYTIAHDGNSLEVQEASRGCVYKGEVQQKGTHFIGAGTYACAGTGESGTWSTPDIVTTEFTMSAALSAQSNFGCEISGRVGGVR